MKFKQPPEETWDRYWAGVYARIERGLAWLLISIGGAVILSYGIYYALLSLIEDPSIEMIEKIAIGALALGGGILLISVIREKWNTWRIDKYKGVIR